MPRPASPLAIARIAKLGPPRRGPTEGITCRIFIIDRVGAIAWNEAVRQKPGPLSGTIVHGSHSIVGLPEKNPADRRRNRGRSGWAAILIALPPQAVLRRAAAGNGPP